MGVWRYGISLRLFNSISSESTSYYFVHCIETLLTRGSRLSSPFKRKSRCHSFTVACQQLIDYFKHVKNYRDFCGVVIRFFSLVEILLKYSSLYNKSISFTSSKLTNAISFLLELTRVKKRL